MVKVQICLQPIDADVKCAPQANKMGVVYTTTFLLTVPHFCLILPKEKCKAKDIAT